MRRRTFLTSSSAAAAVPFLAGCLGEPPSFEIVNETAEGHLVHFRIEGASTGEVIVDREVDVPANGEKEYDRLIEDVPDGGVTVRANTPTHRESTVVFDDYTPSYRIDVVIETAGIVIQAAQP